MLDNNIYNLFAQITEESQSLWRIRNTYMNDVEECDECRDFWERLAQDKEEHIQELERLIMEHGKVCETAMAGSASGSRSGWQSGSQSGSQSQYRGGSAEDVRTPG